MAKGITKEVRKEEIGPSSEFKDREVKFMFGEILGKIFVQYVAIVLIDLRL